MNVRRYLDNRRFWRRLRNAVWILGALGLVYLFVQISEVRSSQKAAADAAYARCLEMGPTYTRVNAWLADFQELARILRADRRAPPPLRDVAGRIARHHPFHVPTQADCLAAYKRETNGGDPP